MSQLIYVKNDALWQRVRRRGRYAITRDCAESPAHLFEAVKAAQKMLVEQLEREGARYVDEPWELRGPLPHIEASESLDPDPGPQARPEITNEGNYDHAAMEKWERAERKRLASDPLDNTDYVDFRVVGTFEVRVPTHYRAHVKEHRR